MPRNSARNSLTIPCLSAQWCLMLPSLALRVAVKTPCGGSRVMLLKFGALYITSPPLSQRGHSASIIDPIVQPWQRPPPPPSRLEQAGGRQGRSFISFYIISSPIYFRSIRLCKYNRGVNAGSVFEQIYSQHLRLTRR